MEFGHLHIFSYSAREGTKAATLPHPVAKTTRQARSRELHSLAAMQRVVQLQSAMGAEVPVLWERGQPELSTGGTCFRHWGYTPNYLRVTAVSDSNLANHITRTRLSAVKDGELHGDVI